MNIIKGIKERFAARKAANSPLAQSLQRHCREFFYSGGLLSDITEKNKQHHIAELNYAWQATRESENPAAFLRETVAGFMLHYAPLQALALREEERPHVGYGKNPNISATLHMDIAHLSRFVNSLKEMDLDERNEEEWIDTCNALCLIDLFYINGMNYMRQELGDVSDPDWFNPLVESLIVCAENDIRRSAGMPLTVNDSADTFCYGNMMHFVMMREPRPYAKWCYQYPDLYLSGHGDPLAKRPAEDFF